MELLGLLGRVAVVFVLLGVVLQVLKRSDGLRGRSSRTGGLQVLTSTRLGKAATLSIVELDGRRLVLGVTASSVTVLTEVEAGESTDPVAVEAADTATTPSFASMLAASTALVPGPRRSPDAVVPPTPAAFLADVWRSARRQPLETAEVSPAAIAAALALASGADVPEHPVENALPENALPADGSAAPRARASRRTAPRTDAQRLEETRPWSRVRPVAAPSADRTAVV